MGFVVCTITARDSHRESQPVLQYLQLPIVLSDKSKGNGTLHSNPAICLKQFTDQKFLVAYTSTIEDMAVVHLDGTMEVYN